MLNQIQVVTRLSMPKQGRPKKFDGAVVKSSFYISKFNAQQLAKVSKDTGVPIAELLRKAVKKIIEEHHQQ